MPQPIDFAADWKATRYDFLEAVTVESLNPDAADGSDVLDTATDVTALVGRETGGEDPMAGGTASVKKRNITLVASEIGFTVKPRDRITIEDGTPYIVGPAVETGGFGALAICKDCERERT